MGSRNIGVLTISHFLFANDTVIFCKAKLDHLRYLCCMFLCFEAVLGLRINMTQPKSVSVRNVNNVHELASIMFMSAHNTSQLMNISLFSLCL
jgi:hypothetical protein